MIETQTLRQIDLDLGGNRTLRVTLTLDQEGNPSGLLMADGLGTGLAFSRPSWHGAPLHLPGSSLDPLVEALRSLQGQP